MCLPGVDVLILGSGGFFLIFFGGFLLNFNIGFVSALV